MSATLTDLMDRLGANTARAASAAYAGWLAGDLTDAELVAAIAGAVEVGIQRGQVLAVYDYCARFYLDAATAGAVPRGAIALKLRRDTDRLAKAARTVLDGPEDQVAMRLDRLARSEVYTATQAQYHDVMTSTPEVTRGWTRGVEPDGCELCGWWSRNGRVWEPDHPMPAHPGCRCHPIPVFRTEVHA